MSKNENRQPPAFIHSALRDHNSLALPSVIRRASGIIIMGRRMKSLIFTTDIAIIRNCNADAVLAVYPFTPQQVIMDAIISASSIPVVCGVGGGVTDGHTQRDAGQGCRGAGRLWCGGERTHAQPDGGNDEKGGGYPHHRHRDQ